MRLRKITYAVLLGMVLGLCVLYIDYQFYFLLIMVLAVPLVSEMLFILSRIGLKIRIETKRQVIFKNETTSLKIRAMNRFPLFITGGKLFMEIGYSEYTKLEDKDIFVRVFLDKCTNSFKLAPKHSGIVIIDVEEFKAYDYLKLFGTQKEFKGQCRLVVLPELLDAENFDSANAKNRDVYENVLEKYGDSDDYIDLREFRPGDNIKQIHWKRSAIDIDGDFIVKQFNESDDRNYIIILDLSTVDFKTDEEEENFRNNLDNIYRMAFSLGNYRIRHGEKACFVAWDDANNDLVIRNFENVEELMQAMIAMMMISCSENAGLYASNQVVDRGLPSIEVPVLVSTYNYENSIFPVIDANADSLDSVL